MTIGERLGLAWWTSWPRPRLPRGGALRVWLFVATLIAAAIGLFLGEIQYLEPIPAPVSVPWWVLAILFFAAEVKVVHFHFRRDAHSLSLNEIPFVIGLFFTPPQPFLLALLLGSGAALAFHRRQSPLKLAFNLAQFWLGAEVALLVLHRLGAFGDGLQLTDWVAPFVATFLNSLLSVLAITMAISLSEGRLQVSKLPMILRLSLVVTVTNTSLALLGVTLLWRDPLAAWLLAIPIATLFLAYRAYVSERQRHERLELLYESSRILQRTPELDSAITGLLRHAQTMFRAEFAEVVLFAPSGDDALRTSVGPDERIDVMVPVPSSDSGLPEGGADRARLFTDPRPYVDSRPDGRVVRDAMVAPLRGETRQIGVLMVANRLGDVSDFDGEDLRLFETMANHIAVALENGQLEQSLAQLTALKEELRYQAYHDSLTSLANRALLVERVEELLAAPPSDGVPVVLFLDLDDFKIVNDSLGHATGDALLVEVGERVRRSLRAGDLAARLGGDEFAVLLVDGPDLRNAHGVAHRISDSLRAPFQLEAGEVPITVSIGVAAADMSVASADELLRNADVAMYTAKARGKGRVVVFEMTMHTAVVERHELGGDLQRAIARGEFVVHYQPIVELRTGRIRAFEALVRWRHPERGVIDPSAFVPLAEETGMIVPLGRWVLEEACRQVKAWNERSPDQPGRAVSVNLSPRQLQQPTFVEDVAMALQSSGLPAELLILEMTESVMLHDTRATVETLETLRSMGVRIAIDDFGTGYSSLSYLRRFPVDVIKIARDFTDIGAHGGDDVAFANAILAMGQALGLEVIAEGIERREQLARLRSLGCELGQGFYFARPLLPIGVEALLAVEPAPTPVEKIHRLVLPRARRAAAG